ncbi:MAG: hypothetical protein Q9200_005561 [Gallowayella weberi]
MLPAAIATCYVRYKAYESAILSWVVSVSYACGFKKPSKVSDNVSNIRKVSGVAGEAGKYKIPRAEILPRVEEIVNCKKPKVQVPRYITGYLKKAIADREKCSAWFQEYYAGDTSIAESTETHEHFTELLKTMLVMLESIAKEPSDSPLSRGHTVSNGIVPLAKAVEAKSKFSCLHVDDLETEEEGSDSSEGSTTAAPVHTPEPSTQFEVIYEAETTGADRTLAMHELLGKLGSMRRHIETTWLKYREQRISLINAYTVTNAALDMAHDLEDQFTTNFPENPSWEDLREVIFPEVTAQWQKDASLWSSDDVDEMDRTFQVPTAFLKTFRDMLEEFEYLLEYPLTWLPEVNDVYDPRQDVSKVVPLEKLKRSSILLDSMLPELALETNFEVFETNDKISAGFEELIKTRQVRLWVTFSFQILCDIHLTLGADVWRPFEDLRLLVERIRRENEDYVKGTDNAVMNESDREEQQRVINTNDLRITEDRMLRVRKRCFKIVPDYEYAAENQKPFFLLSHHPLLSGSMAATLALEWHHSSTAYADVWFQVTAVLHLYSALKQEHCLSTPVPPLEELEDMYQLEKVFFGGRPTGAQAYRNHYLLAMGYSIQWFAKNKRKASQRFSHKSKSKRARHLGELRPLPQLLKKLNPWLPDTSVTLPPLSEVKKLVGEWYATRHGGNPPKSGSRQDDVLSDPVTFLAALSECIAEEQPRLDFEYFRALDLCWRLLRRVEASPRIRKPFREDYNIKDSDPINYLSCLPAFIFERNLEDPQGLWMQSVGETVDKFFREEQAKEQPADLEISDESTSMRYAPGYKMGGDIYHPEQNGKCCHIGVCELQVVHWRLQAGLPPWEDEADADGEWWKGLRADLTEEEEEAVDAAPHSEPSPSPPLDIRPEEILAVLPPHGMSYFDIFYHFDDRVPIDRVREFKEILQTVAWYDGDAELLMPLTGLETADRCD